PQSSSGHRDDQAPASNPAPFPSATESPPPLPAESAAPGARAPPTAPCPRQHRRSSILPGTLPGSDDHVPPASLSPSTPLTIPSLLSSSVRPLLCVALCSLPCVPL